VFAKLNGSFTMIDDGIARGVRDVLSANLRRLRIARHLSLSELARATTMSKATLSGIENGQANPTVETLAALAGALRVSVVELLDELPLGEVRVLRASQARPARRDGIAHRLLESLEGGGDVEVAEIALEARQTREAEPRPEGARTSLYVLEGTLITGPVERSTELGAGDYISFPADVDHVFAAGRRPARALTVTRTPAQR
jgi:transcriptional regulator with XRE-family HTH domain